MPVLKGSSGKQYNLNSTPFAGGGEGDIYDIQGLSQFVAKIYKPDKRSTTKERKLKAMTLRPPGMLEQYAWPTDVLYENGRFMGFVMPKISGKSQLLDVYRQDARKGNKWSFYVTTAKNLAAAVHNVHEIGQVVGDLNHKNIMVDSQSFVTLVDTDSYHISSESRIYRCEVGMLEFVAPELQGVHFPSAALPTFTKETDRFALAVLIFKILMNCAHPFACTVSSGSVSQFQPEENIKKGRCAFFVETKTPNMKIPPYAPDMSALPREIQDLFRRAFVDGHRNPFARPTAQEWHGALVRLEGSLTTCNRNRAHLYYQGSPDCPWCGVEQKLIAAGQKVANMPVTGMLPTPFQTGTVPYGGSTGTTNRTTAQGQSHNLSSFGTIIKWVVAFFYLFWKWILGIAAVIGIIAFLISRAVRSGDKETGQISGSSGYEQEAETGQISGSSGYEQEAETGQISGSSGYEQETETGTESGGPSAEPDGDDGSESSGAEEVLPTLLSGREVESNNTYKEANEIQLEERYAGSLSARGKKGEYDWYAFTLEKPGMVSFSFYTEKQRFKGCYWHPQLYRSGGPYAPVTMSGGGLYVHNDETESHSEQVLMNAGTHYFCVYTYDKLSKDEYQFVIHYEEKMGEEIEPNDDLALATYIEVNREIIGNLKAAYDEDWFVFTVPADGRWRLRLETSLQNLNYEGYWDLDIRSAEDPERKLWNGDWIRGDTELTLLPYMGCPGDSVYYVCVDSGFLAGEGNYRLTVEFEEAGDWEREDNGSFETATPVEFGREYHGALMDRYGKYGEHDWYSFTLEETSEVTLDMILPLQAEHPRFHYWDISIRDKDDSEEKLWGAYFYGEDSHVRSDTLTLEPGTYYVELESGSHWTGEEYTLTVNRN